ncbi:MAG TPA: hypothetical protein VFS21_16120 [Roseiflexaceae bacterium]|nr:hypothetical protein [Roseiflexaceae bacterium]
MRAIPTALLALALAIGALPPAAARAATSCTFERGITTCVITVQSTETQRRTMVSGCMYGPQGVPGRRSRIFEDTYLITATTTTHQHGRHGRIYDSWTEVTRELVESRLVADLCEPI